MCGELSPRFKRRCFPHGGHHCLRYCGGTCRQQYGVCRYGCTGR
nr:hypothetical protein [Escherichia coli]